MQNAPVVSIVLPVYNIKDYLEKCMNSLFNQTYPNIEMILVDDGSTDGSEALCDRFAEKDVRVIVLHKSNGGLSDARNYGIRKARGKYITCVDPDDYVDCDYVEYLLHLVEKYHTKMAICQHRVQYPNGRVKDFGNKGEEVLRNHDCIERMLYHDVIDTSAWAKLYEKALFENVEYPVGKLFEDIGTTYALMLQCRKIAVGYESKYTYILRNNSIVNSSFKRSKLDLLEMTDHMGRDVQKVYPDLEKAVIRRRVYARFSTLNQMLDVSECETDKRKIISFIKHFRKEILFNNKVPKRDKIATFLLSIDYKVYRILWKAYLRVTKG